MDSGVRTRHLKAKILAQLHPILPALGGYEKLDRKDALTRSLYNTIQVNGATVAGCTPCNGYTPPATAACPPGGGCFEPYCARHQF
jgi:hypothetical protein